MWIYWCQSITIGYFARKRMLDLKDFSLSGFKLNPKIRYSKKMQRSLANSFIIAYVSFHFFYLVFLLTQTKVPLKNSLIFLIICIVIFFFNHRYSYIHNRERDRNRVPNISNMAFSSYLRIIPMHFTIFFGFILFLDNKQGALEFF